MKKALILTFSKFQDHEVIYPYYRLLEEEFEVDIMSDKVGRVHGILGTYMESTREVSELLTNEGQEAIMSEYNMLVIPGGVKALEKLRQERQVLEFIDRWDNEGKAIACICHGAQMLISAGVTHGRNISGYYSIKDDIINSGANYIDAPAVVSDNIVTCPHYKWMGQWMLESINVFESIQSKG